MSYLDLEVSEMLWHNPRGSLAVNVQPLLTHVRQTGLALGTLVNPGRSGRGVGMRDKWIQRQFRRLQGERVTCRGRFLIGRRGRRGDEVARETARGKLSTKHLDRWTHDWSVYLCFFFLLLQFRSQRSKICINSCENAKTCCTETILFRLQSTVLQQSFNTLRKKFSRTASL